MERFRKVPMKIFTPTSLEKYELVHPIEMGGFEFFRTQINGEKRGERWSPVDVRLVRYDEREGALREADVPWLGGHALVLKRRATDTLGSFLRDYGELLPLRCADAEMFVYNVTVVLDALDERASDVNRFKDGRVSFISRYAFRPEIVAEAGIFKIPTLRSSPVFFSERAVKVWKSSGVSGIDFREVWGG